MKAIPRKDVDAAPDDAPPVDIAELLAELRALRTPSLLIDVAELARLLAVDERTLRRMRAANEIPKPVAMRGHPRWRRAEIEQFVEKMRHAR